ncbi:hypothetical protein JHK82_031498 [Glycine max]|nr:hypothetical protein JHK82_031498 [Glycine max]KAG5146177.1 hypothetical protein JHK84_031720 [Glycine max]
MMRTLASFSRTLKYECFFAHELVEKDIVGSKRRTSYRRKVEENPTLLLELCGSKKPYTALGTVVGAQSSKLSTLPVNKLIVLFLVFKLDESYTPSKVSIRADDGFHNLKEIKTVELVKATGWVYLSLSGADPR